jgi:hypothetical protein
MIMALVSTAALVCFRLVRYRRSDVEREQLKWFLACAILYDLYLHQLSSRTAGPR